VLGALLMVVLAGCDWTAFGDSPQRTGYNTSERAIGAANVGTLAEGWRSDTGIGGLFRQSPVVANGWVYIGTPGRLLAYTAADGNPECTPDSDECTARWYAETGTIDATPVVANGIVYVPVFGFGAGLIQAYDASGNSDCAENPLGPANPKICQPLWVGSASGNGATFSSPIVANGVLYIGSEDGTLSAFDTTGTSNCSNDVPKICQPLWTAPTGGQIQSATPVDLHGTVYATSYEDRTLYAFDASGGAAHCTGSPKVCAPLWTAYIGSTSVSSPAIAGNVVYVGSDDGSLYAFDARAGRAHCSTDPPINCSPLWTAPTGGHIRSSPSVANGVVYIGSDDGTLRAFDATGSVGCGDIPKQCTALWTATTGNAVESSAAIANGWVYVGSGDSFLYAFHLPTS
jgi:outer membrane protein assembly factor BamB